MDSQYPVFKVLRALPHSRAARKVVIYAPSCPLARGQGASPYSLHTPRDPGQKGRGPSSGPLLDALPVMENAPRGRDALSSHGLNRSTFGDEGLNCRVRDGFGWDPLSMVAPAGGGPHAEGIPFSSAPSGPHGAPCADFADPIRIAVIGNQMKSSAD